MTHKQDEQCQHLLENLGAYIDGDLDPACCDEIEAHIKTCHDCQIIVNTLKETIHLCQWDNQETRLPKEIRQRLFTRLALENDVRQDK